MPVSDVALLEERMMWPFVGFCSAFTAVCGAYLAGQNPRYAVAGVILVFIGLAVTVIAFIATYVMGHDAGIGKPKPQNAYEPGTCYTPIKFFENSRGTRCLVLEDKNGDLSLCGVGDGPIPEGEKLIASVQGDGGVRLVPPQPHIDVIA